MGMSAGQGHPGRRNTNTSSALQPVAGTRLNLPCICCAFWHTQGDLLHVLKIGLHMAVTLSSMNECVA